MGKHLVLVGGGHAHMLTLANLSKFIDRGHKVTVIGPSFYHYYSGMGPGMLGKTYTPGDIRFATRHIVRKQGADFMLGHVVRIDPEGRSVHLKSGETVSYDVLSFNVGSYVPKNNISGDESHIFTVKPIEKLVDAQKHILRQLSIKKIAIGIVGGGASAVETAGNLWRLSQDSMYKPSIQIFAGKNFMSRFPSKLRQKAERSLKNRNIEIMENGYVRNIQSGQIEFETGQTFRPDIIFLAHGVKPSPIFQTSGLPVGPDGGLEVNQYLQSTKYPVMFGGGDCIYFKSRPLDKVGVFAVRQNPVLFHNLMASLEGLALKPFNPGPDYLLILNMGDGTGILHKKWLLLGGKVAFIIKDYIDRKFMKKFQSLE